MKIIKYFLTVFLIAVLTIIVFILYIGVMNLISSPGSHSVMGDVIIPVLFIAIQISIFGVYIRHKFKQLENEFKKMIKFFVIVLFAIRIIVDNNLLL
ncbi:hypothetical protein [Thomasclavelia cocleata]|uniref:hypothetical protein n=1 Tax=Thomasclavelia cocleata TaxID=69824 RepID=UPI00242C94F4|nr:hypothetical protein [Thomasclavelia cocleata]